MPTPHEPDQISTAEHLQSTPLDSGDSSPTVVHTPSPGFGTPPDVNLLANRYELLEEIAAGGMGVVLRCRDHHLHRDLAVKVLHERLRGRLLSSRRFLEEAQITGQLQHPGIVPIHEQGTLPDGRPFIAMKLIQGRTLDNLLNERPTPAHERQHFLTVFLQVCQALAFAHSKGVIHRDLKPANVMVGEFGEVQVMDWGLAKLLSAESPAGAGDLETVRHEAAEGTQAGAVMGTLAYMPPEQARGEVEQIDRRSDVFGLGAILCTILTGRPPILGREMRTCGARLAKAGWRRLSPDWKPAEPTRNWSP